MEINKDISDELKTLSPLLAGLPRVNVFTVLPGYFESISSTVMACLQQDDSSIQSNENNATVPEGYFDNLAGSILDKIKLQESPRGEIKELSPLLHSLQTNNVFEIPEGYFENNQEHVIEKIIAAEELQELSPLLSSIKSENVFKVPSGYFNNLPGNILKKIHPQEAKVVKMPRRNVFLKYAAAAMMTGVIALAVYNFSNNSSSVAPANQSVAVLDASIEKGRQMNDAQFSEAIDNLSENDIAKYLEKHGDITDVASLRNNVNENDLPSQDDYLLDEKTLENYLDKLEITTNN